MRSAWDFPDDAGFGDADGGDAGIGVEEKGRMEVRVLGLSTGYRLSLEICVCVYGSVWIDRGGGMLEQRRWGGGGGRRRPMVSVESLNWRGILISSIFRVQ